MADYIAACFSPLFNIQSHQMAAVNETTSSIIEWVVIVHTTSSFFQSYKTLQIKPNKIGVYGTFLHEPALWQVGTKGKGVR